MYRLHKNRDYNYDKKNHERYYEHKEKPQNRGEIKMIDTKSDKHNTESDDTDASDATYILSVSYRYHERNIRLKKQTDNL